MSHVLTATVTDIQTQTIEVATSDGQRWTLPRHMILGAPVLHQPIFITAAVINHDPTVQHELAAAVLEQLLQTNA